MYPNRPSMKVVARVFTVGFLITALLLVWRNNVGSAQAHFYPANIEPLNQSNLTTGNLALAVKEQSIQTTVVEVRVSAGANDAEQRQSNGGMYLDSTDLELITDPDVAKGTQIVGIRFTDVTIPQGATITNAYVVFQVYQASNEPTSLTLRGESKDNAAIFTTAARDISKRAKTAAGVNWNNIPAWTTVGASVQTPNVAGIIQEIVNRGSWSSGNSLAIIINGTGRRVATAFEGGSTGAALLHIEYTSGGSTATPTPPPAATATPPAPTSTPVSTEQGTVVNVRVAAGANDAEQRVNDGYMYLGSTDLELVTDPDIANGLQSVGLRFNVVDIPQGATITNAYLEFQVDETSSENTSLVFRGHAADNSEAFTNAAYNISNRPKTSASVSWNNFCLEYSGCQSAVPQPGERDSGDRQSRRLGLWKQPVDHYQWHWKARLDCF
jgi:hypothetical protein